MTATHSRTRVPGIVDSSGLFLPTTINNLRLWFDVSQQTGLVDDDLVSTLICVNNPTWNATSSGVNRPTYKTNIVNGLPVVRYAGQKQLEISTVAVGGQVFTKTTWFIVMSRANAANNDYVLGNGAIYSYLQYGTSWYYSTGALENIAFPASSFKLKCAKYDGTNVTLYTNGTQDASPVSSVGCFFRSIGDIGYATNFDIAELLYYDRALTDTERKNVETYLNIKYALW